MKVTIKHKRNNLVVHKDEQRVYTVNEIADILGIGKNAAYNLVKSGKFSCVKIGHTYRISRRSFNEWLENSKRG